MTSIIRLHLFCSAVLLQHCIARRPEKDDVPPVEVDENGCVCVWTEWMNNNDYLPVVGDNNTYGNLRHLYDFCSKPRDIKCRDPLNWQLPFQVLQNGGNATSCDVTKGLLCASRPFSRSKRKKTIKRDNVYYCRDYEISVQCCRCPTTTTVTTTTITTSEALATTAQEVITAQSSIHVFDNDSSELSNEKNKTLDKKNSSDEDPIPLSIILFIITGCILIAIFIVTVTLMLIRLNPRKSPPDGHPVVYEETSPGKKYKQGYYPVETRHHIVPPRIVQTAYTTTDSSSTYETSSEDYKKGGTFRNFPRNSGKVKRKTKGERNRKLNNGNKEDFYLHPLYPHNLYNPPTTTTDEQPRRWFPDEYERSLQQRQMPTHFQ